MSDYGSLADRLEGANDDAERARSAEEFQRRDRDGDGTLTAEEYVGAAQGAEVARRLRDFMRADADGDGEVTLAEWHRLRGTPHAADQILELGDLLGKAAPDAGEALRHVLAGLSTEGLAAVAARLDLREAAGQADAAKRMAAIVRALRGALEGELAGRPDEAAKIDGWLAGS